MDRPSPRSTTLDPTPQEPEPASPDPEEADEAAPDDEASSPGPSAEEASRNEATADETAPVESSASVEAPAAETPAAPLPSDGAPDGSGTTPEMLGDDVPGDEVPGDEAPTAEPSESRAPDRARRTDAEDRPEPSESDGPETTVPHPGPEVPADAATVGGPDGRDDAGADPADDDPADPADDVDPADAGLAGDADDAADADVDLVDDGKSETAFAAPIDVQVIALALVEAATEDAARVSPAPTAPATDPAPPSDPAAEPAPVPDGDVPPFPMPAPPASPARDLYGSARTAVVRRAHDLRGWWTGAGPDGEPAGHARTATRNRRIGIGAVAAVVVLFAVYAIVAVAHADVVPKGTTVAGAEVGGQSTAEAAATLAGALAELAAKPLELVAGEASTTLDPVAAGLAVDVQATADSLTGFSLSPARMWRHLFGAGPAVPVLDVDDDVFASAVGGLEDSMAVDPVDGAVEFAGIEPASTPARDGTRIDPGAAGRAITSAWLVADGPVELPTRAVPPEITREETEAAVAQAEQIVSGPVEVKVGGQSAQLPPKVLAAAVSFVEKDGALAPRFDGATLTQAIVERTDDLLTAAEGAQFGFASGRPEVVGGELGTTLADKPTRAAIRAAALGDDRTATLEVVRQTPENSTQALRAMGVEEVVAEFSTPLTSDYVRTQNLIRGAEMITGDLIRPGETFSLVSALSPITLANGYVASGMIIGGQHIDGVGGGLSQMATTTYNAAMIAGFEDVEHHPHSYWFERYPAGREATIAVGSKDMKVRNNTPYGAVLQSWVADNQLHVRIWSTKHLRNTWTDGEKRNIVPAGVVNSTDPGCVAYAGGQPGFTITVDRKVERISDGKVVIERSYTTTYRPDHALACVAPPPPDPPENPGGDDTAPTPPGPEG
ncbi:VanW family protein [Myceligenerans pegani]|uniref:VanW family protein n=1 Tax=Myceligenerans pegani TaxID=2776917 RepID=A0ABR9N0X5_9MICO|nr:VanW family protein [Myceligenerans sp. TRM 65318]MBE1876804.1 VanW family protein [Myceligenerans sp. TRM 65318]MBE3019075.1 VanW family protein [Myceligenerans sp. TRM 65318]